MIWIRYIAILFAFLPVMATAGDFAPKNNGANSNAVNHHTTNWNINPGTTLKSGLEFWAARERCSAPGVTYWGVIWLTSTNYRIDAPLMFNSGFKQAVTSLFELYSKAQIPLYLTFHNNQCLITVDSKRN